MAFSEEFLQELKARNEIESLVSSYVNLKRRGKNCVGLCPFHNEKTPSFTLYPENGSFYCFGCGTGGDVIRFVMLAENLDYVEAVRFLAARAGMSMPENGYDDSLLKLKNTILEINRETARFFHACLSTPDGAQGVEYFQSRALAPKTIRHFGLGFAPDSWDKLTKHLKAKGFAEDDLIQARVAARGRKGGVYDVFRRRLMFPILDLRGNVIAFGGRKLPEQEGPKYINTADTPVYKKSSHVYALNFAKNHAAQQIILCEGYMDVIALHQAGFQNAVAPLGTSFTAEQAKLLSRYTNEVVLTMDADSAGQKATERAISLLNETGLKVRVIRVPDGKDPDEFLRSHGADGPQRFKGLLEGAGNDVEYRLFQLSSRVDTATDDGKVAFLNQAAEVLGSLRSAIERDVYATKLAEQYGVAKRAILTQAEESARRVQRREEKRQIKAAVTPQRNDPLNPQRLKYPRAANAEEGILAILLKNPDYGPEMDRLLKPEDFLTDFNKKVYNTLQKRIKEGKPLDLTLMSGEFTGEELGKIVEIQTKESARTNTREEWKRCISVLMEEREKYNLAGPAGVSDEQYMEQMNRLAEKKRGGQPQ